MEENVHRLAGSAGDEQGGLIIKKKKDTEPTFKVPRASLLGLDRLAALKRREKEDAARKMSFSIEEENAELFSESPKRVQEKPKDERKFRVPAEETPTYTGGVTKEARERLLEREKDRYKEKGVYATSKDKSKHNRNHERRSGKHDRDRDRKERYKHRDRDRHRSSRHGDSSHREETTPRFRDEPKTPNLKVKDGVSKASWDEEDFPPMKRSTWDFPTPNSYKKVHYDQV